MTKTVSDFTRNEIRRGLEKLIPESVAFFHRLYPMGVDLIPDNKLDTALSQVERSLQKPHLCKETPHAPT